MNPDQPPLAELDPRSSDEAGVTAPVAALRSVSKRFGETQAVEEISIELRAGEVLALVGENGAGKSTCVKLFAGVHEPDSGHVELEGQPVHFHSPLDAHRSGIAVVHQHPGLFGELSITENVFAGYPRRDRFGRLDHRRMAEEVAEWLDLLELDAAPGTLVKALRPSEQQLVEIIRALVAEAKVMILDEPTASLPSHEVDRFFEVVEQLRGRGVALMFVSHRLDEIFRISDRISVLRDGRHVATTPTAELSSEEIVRLMVGRPLSDLYPRSEVPIGETVLTVEALSRSGAFEDVDLELRAGEIVGLGGLVGSGRSEVARAIFGVEGPDDGAIALDGESVRIGSASEAMRRGIAYVSEDRRGQSLILDFGILANATLPSLGEIASHGFVRRRSEIALVEPFLEAMKLRYAGYDQAAGDLSGGNQQKVVLAKWLATEPRVLILDEPTQGIDVQTKAEVHRTMVALAERGVAILLISSDLPELLGMCDRVAVMREGRVVGQFGRDEATQERIAGAAAGVGAGIGIGAPASTEAAPAAASAAERAGRSSSLARRLLHRRELSLVLAMIAVAIPVTAINSAFLTTANFRSILGDAGLLVVVVLAQMLVLLTRNIDLSVGSVVGLSAYVSAASLQAHPQLSIVLAVLIACGVGLACGAINGAIVTIGKVPAIVATLGTLAIFRGLTTVIAGNDQVDASEVPQSWLNLTDHRLLGVPELAIVGLVVCLIAAALLRWTESGRDLFAIGSNPEGARLVGVRIDRRVMGAFMTAGLLAGLTGALWASHYATVDARSATGLEFIVIASAVVGGVAIFGGAGTVPGVVLGTLTLLVIKNGLALARVQSLWVQAVYGAVIVATIAVDTYLARRMLRRLRSPG